MARQGSGSAPARAAPGRCPFGLAFRSAQPLAGKDADSAILDGDPSDASSKVVATGIDGVTECSSRPGPVFPTDRKSEYWRQNHARIIRNNLRKSSDVR